MGSADTGARERIARGLRAARDRRHGDERDYDFLRELAVDGLQALDALAAGVGVPPDADLVAQSAENADVRGRAQRVINQAMESSGPPATGTPERVLWDTAVGLARDVIALTDKVYDRGSDALVNDVEPEGAAAGDPPSREDARSLHASGGRRLAARPGSLARREVFPPDSAVAPAGVGEARPAARRVYEAVIKVAVADAPERRARDIAEGIGYACALLMDEYGWTAEQIGDVLERTQDDVQDQEAQRG